MTKEKLKEKKKALAEIAAYMKATRRYPVEERNHGLMILLGNRAKALKREVFLVDGLGAYHTVPFEVEGYPYLIQRCVGGKYARRGFSIGTIRKGKPVPRVVVNVDPVSKVPFWVLIFEEAFPYE